MKRKILIGLILSFTIIATTTTALAYLQEDLNQDGTVSVADIAEAAKAFGSYQGHERWNANADLNGDGVVNIIDVVRIAKAFGQTE